MERTTIKIGVIGCGNISDVYIKNLTQVFGQTSVTAVVDIRMDRAYKMAEKYGIPTVCATHEELYALPDVDVVLVLTQPGNHTQIVREVLEAGKHVYVEKPLAFTREDAQAVMELAAQRNLYISSAPDTILGAPVQTGKKLIEDGWIGDIVGATCAMSFTPPETWHPDPAFLYKEGAGPLFDNAPYSLLTLSYLMGSICSIQCAGRKTYGKRTITSQPHYGEQIDVEVPTYLQAVLTFDSGAIASLMHSVDSPNCRANEIGLEIYGSKGMISLPSPGMFSGKVFYKRNNCNEWVQMPLINGYDFDSRGIGLADMAAAIQTGRSPRLSRDLVFHTIDALDAMNRAWQSHAYELVESKFENTPILAVGIPVGEV